LIRSRALDCFRLEVDAKLVTEPGMTLSLDFEFIENDGTVSTSRKITA